MLTSLSQIDFAQVYGPAGYKDAPNAKVMFGRLFDKILGEDVKGTSGRKKRTSKAKDTTMEESTASGGAADGSELSTPSGPKTPKKRKTANSANDGTPTKRRRAPKESAAVEEETVAEGSGAIEGKPSTFSAYRMHC